MVVSVQLKTGEVVQMPGNPIKLSNAQQKTYSCPPSLGEHTDEILSGLMGYDADQLAQLRALGAIA